MPNSMSFFLIYKSKKSFHFSFSSWLIKATGLHTCLMKLLPIYKNTLQVYAIVSSLFNLVKLLQSLRTWRLFFHLKPVFCLYAFFWPNGYISHYLKSVKNHLQPHFSLERDVCVTFFLLVSDNTGKTWLW